MEKIIVSHLKKNYRVHQKKSGFIGTIRSLINRQYKNIPAVDDVSFSISKGELIGFIGPNGAGKTTTLKCLSGLLCPTSGSVRILGFTPFERKPEFLRKISLVMGQKNQLWWDLPPMESFLLNKEIYNINDTTFHETLNELCKLLEVQNLMNTPVRKLSLGERMKCELVAALLHRPKMLFLDEPTIGLDVVMQKNMRDFISIYNKRYNATILLTSHYMNDVRSLCKRVLIIDHGKLIYDGRLDDLVKQYATYKLLKVIFNNHVDIRNLEEIGEVKNIKLPEVVFAVPRDKISKRFAKLLRKYDVDDLNIEEPNIEDIIREVFSEKEVKRKKSQDNEF